MRELTLSRSSRDYRSPQPRSLQITAFNFPVAVYGWNLSLALITGNATIWKPAPSTPLTAIATNKLLVDVLEANGMPGSLSSLVCGGGDVGGKLVGDKRVDLVSFTGSEARGRLVGMEVAGRFGKSLLEVRKTSYYYLNS